MKEVCAGRREPELTDAHHFLRERQAAWAHASPVDVNEDTLERALQHVRDRAAAARRDGGWVREGALKYPLETEQKRWALTAEILERIQPGPHEDANYIAMLARQAASIELAMIEASADPVRTSELLSHILVGTTGEPLSRGSSTPVGDRTVIQMSAGMMDLLYQTSKAVVLSWRPTVPASGTSVAFSSLAEDTKKVLDSNPRPVELLFDTVAAWLYDGMPRASSSTAPPPEYHPPLTVLINGSERFVLAHEYGHSLMDQLAPVPATETPPWDRELRADTFALHIVAESSALLDCLPPNMSLQGAVLGMRAHELLEAAVQVANTGRTGPPRRSPTHPPFEQRVRMLEEVFVVVHDDPSAAREALPGMLIPSQTVNQLWRRVEPILRVQFRAGRRLHRMWTS